MRTIIVVTLLCAAFIDFTACDACNCCPDPTKKKDEISCKDDFNKVIATLAGSTYSWALTLAGTGGCKAIHYDAAGKAVTTTLTTALEYTAWRKKTFTEASDPRIVSIDIYAETTAEFNPVQCMFEAKGVRVPRHWYALVTVEAGAYLTTKWVFERALNVNIFPLSYVAEKYAGHYDEAIESGSDIVTFAKKIASVTLPDAMFALGSIGMECLTAGEHAYHGSDHTCQTTIVDRLAHAGCTINYIRSEPNPTDAFVDVAQKLDTWGQECGFGKRVADVSHAAAMMAMIRVGKAGLLLEELDADISALLE